MSTAPTHIYTLSLHDALPILQKQSPIMDTAGSVPLMLVLGEDKRSVRAFERLVDGRRLEFFQKTEAGFQLIDSETGRDRKSTRLNSSHVSISYAVFCLKKKKT